MKVPGGREFLALGGVLTCLAGAGCGANPSSGSHSSDTALDVKRTLALSWQPQTAPLRRLPAESQGPPAADSMPPIVATDGDVPNDNGALWVIEPRGSQARVTELGLGRREAAPVGSWSVQTVPQAAPVAVPTTTGVLTPPAQTPLAGPPPAAYDVGRWNQAVSSTDLFTFSPRQGRGVEVRVHTLERASRVTFQGNIPIPPPARGVDRDYSIVTWEGSQPDAVIVDRGLARQRVRVSIFSGESGFRRELANAVLPFTGAKASDWSVDVGRLNQPRPDLLFFTRDPNRSRAEVHVAAGEDDFQRFFYEKQMAVPTGLPPTYHYAFGVWQGAESFLGVDFRVPGHATVQVVPLVQPAGSL